MKTIITILTFFIFSYTKASDTAFFSCKYRYIKQKDSENINSKFDDVMILSVNKSSSLYYSYLKQFGNRNLENDANNNLDAKDKIVPIDSKNRGNYFFNNESEVIEINYPKKDITVSDNIMENSFFYHDTLIAPVWSIEKDTATILNLLCQKATTNFRGRSYTAWFTSLIPLNSGPWYFNGLPGLILKISDSKNQFEFYCIELNIPNKSLKVFKPYDSVKKISKEKLCAKKRLLAQNYLAFMQAEGKTIMMDGVPAPPRANKPYNPIDLTQ